MSAVKCYVLVIWLLHRFHVTSWERPMIKQCGQSNLVSNRLCRPCKLKWSVRMDRLMPWSQAVREAKEALESKTRKSAPHVLCESCLLRLPVYGCCLLMSNGYSQGNIQFKCQWKAALGISYFKTFQEYLSFKNSELCASCHLFYPKNMSRKFCLLMNIFVIKSQRQK